MSIFEHDNHKALWTWLSKNPGAVKRDYFDIKKIFGRHVPVDGCYACKGADKAYLSTATIEDYTGLCDYCPLNWDTGLGQTNCTAQDTYYIRWENLSYAYRQRRMRFAYNESGHSFAEELIFAEELKIKAEVLSTLALQIANLPLKESK